MMGSSSSAFFAPAVVVLLATTAVFVVVDAQLTATWDTPDLVWTARDKPGIVCLADTIWLHAGWPQVSPIERDTWIYTAADGRWNPVFTTGDTPQKQSHTFTYTNGSFFSIGGQDLGSNTISDIYKLDEATRAWERIPGSVSDPSSRYRHTVVAPPATSTHNGKLFLLFGIGGTGNHNDVWEYDTAAAGSWRRLHAGGTATVGIPPPSFDVCCDYKADTDEIVCFGGTGSTDYNDLWKFTIATRTWTLLTSTTSVYVPERRRLAHCAIVGNTKFVNFGGWSAVESRDVGTAEVFDFATNQWSSANSANMPNPRDGGRSCAFQGKYVQLGGWQTQGRRNEVWEYDLTTRAWRLVRPQKVLPPPRGRHISAIYQSRMFVLCGMFRDTLLSDVWTLDLDTSEWSQRTPGGITVAGRRDAASAIRGSSIWIYGGVTDDGLSNALLSYDINTNSWSAHADGGNSPARSGHGMAAWNDRLFVFGGLTAMGPSADLLVYDDFSQIFRAIELAAPATAPEFALPNRHMPHLYPDLSRDALMLYGGFDRISGSGMRTHFALTMTGSYTANVTVIEASPGPQIPAALQNMLRRAGGPTVAVGQHVLTIAGALSDPELYPFPPADAYVALAAYGAGDAKTLYILPPPETRNVYGTAVYYKNRVVVFGGIAYANEVIRFDMFYNHVETLRLSSLCPFGEAADTAACAHCAAGSQNPSCALAPAGHSQQLPWVVPEPCAEGTAVDATGSQERRQCVICDAGTFNNITGATACLPCNPGAFCPAGSLAPEGVRNSTAITFSEQPSELQTGFVPGWLIGVNVAAAAFIVGAVLLFIVATTCLGKRHIAQYTTPEFRGDVLDPLHDDFADDKGDVTLGALARLIAHKALAPYAKENDGGPPTELEIYDALCKFDQRGTRRATRAMLHEIYVELVIRGFFLPAPGSPAARSGKEEFDEASSLSLLKFEDLDYFEDSHSLEANGEARTLHHTTTGAVMTLGYVMTACFVLALSLAAFQYDNLIETRATLPPVIASTSVRSDLTFTVSIAGVRDPSICIDTTTVNDARCIAENLLYTDLVTPEKEFTDTATTTLQILDSGAAWAGSGRPYTTCVFSGTDTCNMTFHCAGCGVNKQASVDFLFTDTRVFSRSIALEATARSGVKNINLDTEEILPAPSAVSQLIRTSQAATVFKGAPATVKNLEMTATQFKAPKSPYNQQLVEDEGYHVHHSTVTRGREVTSSEFLRYLGVPVNFSLTTSPSSLVVNRLPKQTPLELIMAILGSISGLAGTFAYLTTKCDENVEAQPPTQVPAHLAVDSDVRDPKQIHVRQHSRSSFHQQAARRNSSGDSGGAYRETPDV